MEKLYYRKLEWIKWKVFHLSLYRELLAIRGMHHQMKLIWIEPAIKSLKIIFK